MCLYTYLFQQSLWKCFLLSYIFVTIENIQCQYLLPLRMLFQIVVQVSFTFLYWHKSVEKTMVIKRRSSRKWLSMYISKDVGCSIQLVSCPDLFSVFLFLRPAMIPFQRLLRLNKRSELLKTSVLYSEHWRTAQRYIKQTKSVKGIPG